MLHANDELGALILEGKTTAPEFNTAFVQRSELIDALRSGTSRLVTVTAPAGYGKTSFLAEWKHTEERATGWLTFRKEDDDPAAVVRLLAHACLEFAPEAALIEQISTVDGGVLRRAAPALALALSRSEQPFVLFLDDMHVLGSDDCIDALDIILAGVPSGSQAVLASRHHPTRFARGLVKALAAQVGAEDLRIDATGAARLAEVAGVQVDRETLDSWVEQCGGWAAGIHMCALLSKSMSRLSVGEDTLLSDYLYQECMKELPEATRQFLLRSSVLQVHLPDLCDAVLERSDSARILRDLETRQLFVTSDRGRRSYRLHPLFREYLQTELHLEASSSVPGLHLRASGWFQGQGQLPAAIEHAIAAQQFDLATGLVTAAAIDAYEAGQVATLGRWLREIGDANVIANPSAVVVFAWFSILAGGDDAADKWSTLLGGLPDDAHAQGIVLPSAKAMIRAIRMKDGLESALRDAEFAISAEPIESQWRDPALQILGSTLLHAGHEDRAQNLLNEAIHTAHARGNPASIVICETEFALLAIENDDWAVAEQRTETALGTIESHGIEGYVMCAYAHAAAACVDLHRGRRIAGERYLAMAMSERSRCGRSVPLLAIPARLLMARAQLQLGDGDAARILLREIAEMLPPNGGRDALDRRVSSTEVALREHERQIGQRTQSVALTAAEQRVLPYLQTHLTRAEIAQRLYVSPNTIGTQISAIFRKFEASNRTEAVRRAFDLGLLGMAPAA